MRRTAAILALAAGSLLAPEARAFSICIGYTNIWNRTLFVAVGASTHTFPLGTTCVQDVDASGPVTGGTHTVTKMVACSLTVPSGNTRNVSVQITETNPGVGGNVPPVVACLATLQ